MTKFSIIVPVYNVEKYLKECLDSIVNQTFGDFEIICINDESTDRSLDILKEYSEHDSRFVVISQKNQGQGVARNKGINLAKGEYVLFVDPDDWIELNTLEILNKKISCSYADIIQFNHITYNDYTGKKRVHLYHKQAKRAFGHKLIKDSIYNWTLFRSPNRLKDVPFATWDKAYKLEFLKKAKIKFAPFKHGEDHIFSISSLILAKKIHYISTPLYYYRYRQNSAVNKATDDNFCIFDVALLVKNFLIEQHIYDDYIQDFKKYIIKTFKGHYGCIPKESTAKYLQCCERFLNTDEFKNFKRNINKDFTFWEKLFCLKNKKINGIKVKYVNLFGLQFVIKRERDYEKNNSLFL